ncbi:formate acetyltransferase 1 [Salmonella bongori]|nr:formate acetyltransferase 1 [Salmonella bongori]
MRGDESFLAGATEATTTLWDSVMEGVKQEKPHSRALFDFDTSGCFYHHFSRRGLHQQSVGKNCWSANLKLR